MHRQPSNQQLRSRRSSHNQPSSSIDDTSPNPINYSGTQVNIYGNPSPGNLQNILDQVERPHIQNGGPYGGVYPYGNQYPPRGYTGNVQLGLVTDHMLRKLDESRLLTMTELLRRSYPNNQYVQMDERHGNPAIEDVTSPRQPVVKAVSPAGGDWKGQIDHVYAHLLQAAKENNQFRDDIGEPFLGDIIAADLEETESSYVLAIEFSKAGKKNVISNSHTENSSVEKPRQPQRRTFKSKPKRVQQEEEESAAEYEKENYIQEGTLKSYKPFNPESDAEILRKAMKGMGTDEEAIINIFAKRTSKQRIEIVKSYKTLFGKDLVKDLKSELSGELWTVIRSMCFTLPDYDAAELRRAIKGLGTDDQTLIEIICTRSNRSMHAIKESYYRMFNRDLEEDVAGDTSGHYQRLLVAMLQANRDESDIADKTMAIKDAKALVEAGVAKWGTDESRFNALLVQRSYPQLRSTFRQYEKISGKTMEESIKREMSGDLAHGMLTIVRCIENKAAYFARQIYKAMKGAGTDDGALTRIIVSRCEVDMVQIKEVFENNYQQRLSQFINDDTSGDYRKILLVLIGEPGGTKPSSKKSTRSSMSRRE